jgi:hypothetical protein
MATSKHLEAIAAAAHMANRALCLAQGDTSQLPWKDAPEWQRESALKGVVGALAGNTPEESHASWMAEKVATGWTYGPVKDPANKRHPCMVPYDALPPSQRIKDQVFIETVRAIGVVLDEAEHPLREVVRADLCPHEAFTADVKVVKIVDLHGYMAEVHVACASCATPFHFKGLPFGVSPGQPHVGADGTELRAPIGPGPAGIIAKAVGTPPSQDPPALHITAVCNVGGRFLEQSTMQDALPLNEAQARQVLDSIHREAARIYRESTNA